MTMKIQPVVKNCVARALVAAALAIGPSVAMADNQTILVKLDQAKVVKLPDKAQTLIIGNPIIADVTLLRGGATMVITGKGFGSTNLIVLDNSGSLVAESIIQVVAANGSLLVVQRGAERESYSCSPRCEPTVQLGDSKVFSSDAVGQIQARNSLALPQSGPR